jgi:cytochrome c oxidase subunit 4
MAFSPAAQEESDRLIAHHGDAEIPASALDGARIAWPKDKLYWFIFGALLLITLLEVSTYTHPDVWGDLATPSLIFLMAIKFFIVTWFFMHLRNDSRLLTMVFYFGLALALVVYLITMTTLHYFA